MSLTLEELQTLRDALVKKRLSGVSASRHGETQTNYKSDAEMAAAIAALDDEIAGLTPRSRASVASFSRGDW